MNGNNLLPSIKCGSADPAKTHPGVNQLHWKAVMVIGNPHFERAAGSGHIDNQNIAFGLLQERTNNPFNLNELAVVDSSTGLLIIHMNWFRQCSSSKNPPLRFCNVGGESNTCVPRQIQQLPWTGRSFGYAPQVNPSSPARVLHKQIRSNRVVIRNLSAEMNCRRMVAESCIGFQLTK